MYIIYESLDEVIICTPENEKQTLYEWFEEGGRNLQDYDKYTSEESSVVITFHPEVL